MVFIKLWSFKFEYIFEIEMFITVEQAKILKLVITLRKARAQTVKNPPAMQETQVRSLGRADPLQKGMATHSTVLAWRIPWTEEPGGLQSMGLQRVRQDWVTNTFVSTVDAFKNVHDFNFIKSTYQLEKIMFFNFLK